MLVTHAEIVRAFGQAVCNAFVAVDTGLRSSKKEALVGVCRARALPGNVHRDRGVAVAALQAVICLQSNPLVLCEFTSFLDKLLSRVDRTEDLAPDLLGGLHFSGDLVGPLMWDVTVGTTCPNTRAIGIVDCALQISKDVIAHFMATGAKHFGVRDFKCSIEPAPKYDTGNEPSYGEYSEA